MIFDTMQMKINNITDEKKNLRYENNNNNI